MGQEGREVVTTLRAMLLVVTLTSLAAFSAPVNAQDLCHGAVWSPEPSQLPLGKPSTDRIVIRGQVQLGIMHANRGLDALRALSFEEAIKDIRLSYFNLRFAGSGVEWNLQRSQNRRIPDPLFEMAEKALLSAMEHTRYALTAAQACSQARMPQAVERLENAIADATEAENLL
jgi:hypothetical protein